MAKLKFQPIKGAQRAKAVPGESGSRAPTKLTTIVALLQRPGGASMDELTAATGWQSHSIRGAVAGALKKQLRLAVLSEKTAAGRVYRIPDAGGV
jgi:hypothetical protein